MYRFKGDLKGLAFKATIKDITVVGNTLAIDITLIKLTTAVRRWLFGLALAVLLAIWSWGVPAWAALPSTKSK